MKINLKSPKRIFLIESKLPNLTEPVLMHVVMVAEQGYDIVQLRALARGCLGSLLDSLLYLALSETPKILERHPPGN